MRPFVLWALACVWPLADLPGGPTVARLGRPGCRPCGCPEDRLLLVMVMVDVVAAGIAAAIGTAPAGVAGAFVAQRPTAARAIRPFATLPAHQPTGRGYHQPNRCRQRQQRHPAPNRHDPGQQRACLPARKHHHRHCGERQRKGCRAIGPYRYPTPSIHTTPQMFICKS